MTLIRGASALLAILAISACSRGPEPFQMTVDNVQSFRGFMLKGLGASGTVEQGCIAANDVFVVKRDGKVVYEDSASMISVDQAEGYEAGAGQKVEFYLRDAPDGAVQAGDILEAKETTCKKDKEK